MSKLLDCFQTLAGLLYEAAVEGGYADPRKVEEILDIPWVQGSGQATHQKEGSTFTFLEILSEILIARFLEKFRSK